MSITSKRPRNSLQVETACNQRITIYNIEVESLRVQSFAQSITTTLLFGSNVIACLLTIEGCHETLLCFWKGTPLRGGRPPWRCTVPEIVHKGIVKRGSSIATATSGEFRLTAAG